VLLELPALVENKVSKADLVQPAKSAKQVDKALKVELVLLALLACPVKLVRKVIWECRVLQVALESLVTQVYPAFKAKRVIAEILAVMAEQALLETLVLLDLQVYVVSPEQLVLVAKQVLVVPKVTVATLASQVFQVKLVLLVLKADLARQVHKVLLVDQVNLSKARKVHQVVLALLDVLVSLARKAIKETTAQLVDQVSKVLPDQSEHQVSKVFKVELDPKAATVILV